VCLHQQLVLNWLALTLTAVLVGAGEGCALHPAYASYALNKSSEDVVAQYVANALACATATDKGGWSLQAFCCFGPAAPVDDARL
jgi:hypothetical protein